MKETAPAELLNAVKTLRHFLDEECADVMTSVIKTKKDQRLLYTDWGYFIEGLDEIEDWAKGVIDLEEDDETN